MQSCCVIMNRAGYLQVNELSVQMRSSLYLLCVRVTGKNIKHAVFYLLNEMEFSSWCIDEKYFPKYKMMLNIF